MADTLVIYRESEDFGDPTLPTLPVTSTYEAETAEFITRAGASANYGALNSLVAYLKRQGLWARCLIAPCKAASNKGSGATLYTLGGLRADSSADIALTGSPVWGATGLQLANLKYGTATVPGIRASTNLYTFRRRILQSAIAGNAPEDASLFIGHLGSSVPGENRGWTQGGGVSAWSTETATMAVSDTGFSPPIIATTLLTGAIGEEATIVWRAANGGNTALWKNTTQITLDLAQNTTTSMSPAAAGYTTDNTVYFNARRLTGVVSSGTKSVISVFYLLYDGSARDLTSQERIDLTNLVNAQ
ncbi:MAG: hypothetical protein V4726_05685 [Verrucomicrobiota bacterium]